MPSKIIEILNLIKQYENQNSKISEIDTQVLLVEPILSLIGFDINNPFILKRANRASNSKAFDIEVYDDNRLHLAIEVKALSSKEFNIDEVILNPNKLKSVYRCQDKKFNIGTIIKCGDLWRNCLNDGVGQLKAYLQNYGYASLNNKRPIPILTNGEKWVIFSEHFYETKNKTFSEKEILCYLSINEQNFKDKINNSLSIDKEY